MANNRQTKQQHKNRIEMKERKMYLYEAISAHT